MNVIEAIFQRRSVRKFKDTKITKEIINVLLECAMAGPSACNKKPWEFYVITNEEILTLIKDSSRYSKYDAPLAIVVCGNTFKSLSKKDNDFWIQDCSAAIENILLACVELGLGSVWCGLYPMEKPANNIKNILNTGDDIIPLGIVYIGYPDQELESRTQYDDACVHYLD